MKAVAEPTPSPVVLVLTTSQVNMWHVFAYDSLQAMMHWLQAMTPFLTSQRRCIAALLPATTVAGLVSSYCTYCKTQLRHDLARLHNSWCFVHAAGRQWCCWQLMTSNVIPGPTPLVLSFDADGT